VNSGLSYIELLILSRQLESDYGQDVLLSQPVVMMHFPPFDIVFLTHSIEIAVIADAECCFLIILKNSGTKLFYKFCTLCCCLKIPFYVLADDHIPGRILKVI